MLGNATLFNSFELTVTVTRLRLRLVIVSKCRWRSLAFIKKSAKILNILLQFLFFVSIKSSFTQIISLREIWPSQLTYTSTTGYLNCYHAVQRRVPNIVTDKKSRTINTNALRFVSLLMEDIYLKFAIFTIWYGL